jgi:DNA-binding NarL/FixJ family response regulator
MSDPPRAVACGSLPRAERAERSLRVVVLAEHRVVRESVSRVLQDSGGIAVAGSAGGIEELAAVVRRLRPHVVVAEPEVSDDAARALLRLRTAAGDAGLVLLVSAGRDELVRAAVRLRISGLFVEDSTGEELVESVREVARGTVTALRPPSRVEPVAPPRVTRRPRTSRILTDREIEVLTTLAEGRSSADTAVRLSISAETLKAHVKNILAKLGVHTRVEAFVAALRLGLIPPGYRG